MCEILRRLGVVPGRNSDGENAYVEDSRNSCGSTTGSRVVRK